MIDNPKNERKKIEVIFAKVQIGGLVIFSIIITILLIFIVIWIKSLILFIIYLLLDFVLLLFIYHKCVGIYYDYIHEDNQGQHGKQVFASHEEICEQYKNTPYEGEFEGLGGLVIAWKNSHTQLVDTLASNTLVWAITRGGKGEIVILPTIDNISRGSIKQSMVIFDKKPELANLLTKKLVDRGYDVRILNLKDPDKSISYNPLQRVIDFYVNGRKDKAEYEMLSVAETLIANQKTVKGGSIWTKTSRILLRCGVYVFLEEYEEGKRTIDEITLYNVMMWIRTHKKSDEEGITRLEHYFENKSDNLLSKKTYNAIDIGAGETLASIFLTTEAENDIYTNELIAKLTSRNDLDMLDFGYGEKPIALFIVPATQNEGSNQLISCFIDQMFVTLDENTEYTKGKMDRNVHLILDEFASYKKIQSIGKIISTGLGKGFRTMIVLQELSQARKEYSKEEVEEIISNCSNKVYILSDNQEENEKLSKQIGMKTVEEISKSGGFMEDKNISISYKKKPLISADELKMMKLGEIIVQRVNFRRDYLGRDVTPYPIINRGEHRMIMSYEYMEKDYSSITELAEIHSQIIGNHQRITLDYKDIDKEVSSKINIQSEEKEGIESKNNLNLKSRIYQMYFNTDISYLSNRQHKFLISEEKTLEEKVDLIYSLLNALEEKTPYENQVLMMIKEMKE